jgi:PAS domain S-box-containing protein
MYYKENRLLVLLIGFIMFLTFCSVLLVGIIIKVSNNNSKAANETKKIIDRAETFSANILAYETNIRGFLLVKDSLALRIADAAITEAKNDLTILTDYTKSNASLKAIVDSLVYFTNLKIERNNDLLAATNSTIDIKPGRKVMLAIFDKKNNLKSTEEFVYNAIISRNNKIITGLQMVTGILIGLVTLFIVLLIFYFNNQLKKEKEYNKLMHQKNLLIQNSNDAIITTNDKLEILSWNLGAENMIGYSEQEVLGKKLSAIIEIEFSSTDEKENFKHALSTKGFWKGELVQISKRGERKNILASYSATYNFQNKITGYSSIRTDITKQKKLEQELRNVNAWLEKEVEQKTKEIKENFERIQKGFISFNTDKRITYINKFFADFLGKTQKELIGEDYTVLLDGIENTPFLLDGVTAHFEQRIISNEIFVEQLNVWTEYTIYPAEDGISVYFTNISNKKKIENELKEKNKQLQILTNHIEHLREEERKQIARDLHDDLGQIATVLKIDITRLKNLIEPNNQPLTEKAEKLLDLCSELIYKIKKISFDLRPDILDNIGLTTTLDNHCKEFAKNTGIACSFYSSHINKRLDPKVETTLFRILQEALTNIIRHAKATQVMVSLLEENNKFILTITDNGIGFDIENTGNGLGIVGMKERANSIQAIFSVNSTLNNGTTINVSYAI